MGSPRAAAASEPLDVAVVGGGPGGLATALALRRAVSTLSVKVFEASPDIHQPGASVLMHVNGWRALAAIDPDLAGGLWDKRITVKALHMHDMHGQLTTRMPTGAMAGDLLEKTGWQPALLAWQDIRGAMYDMLPGGSVELEHRFAGYEAQGDGGGLLTFDTSGGGRAAVAAAYVVGADGFYSRVRQRALGDAPPDFSGSVMWRGKLDLSASAGPLQKWLAEQDPECRTAHRWIQDPAKGFQTRFMAVYPIRADTLLLSGNAPVAELELLGLTYDHERRATSAVGETNDAKTAAQRELWLQAFAGFPGMLLDAITAIPAGDITEHGLFRRSLENLPEGARWGRGRITLIGDAAHVGAPDGQGLNLAIEDAAVLAASVQQHGLSEAALRDFELARIPRVRDIQRYTERNPERMQLVLEDVVKPLVSAAAES
eukprot:jgi/Tetstr1/444786/TSEL_032634.t1